MEFQNDYETINFIINELDNYKNIEYLYEISSLNSKLPNLDFMYFIDIMYPYKFSSDILSNKILFGNSREVGHLSVNPELIFTDNYGNYLIMYNQKIYIPNNDYYFPVLYFNIEMHEQSPHNYNNYLHLLKDKINPNKQNIIVDCGSSEGIFEILVANRYDISNILFVCIDPEPLWNDSISHTLDNLGANYLVINEMISKDNSLNDILSNHNLDFNDVICIKADIEGAEVDLIKNIKDYFITNKPLNMICTYHNQDDAYDLYDIFKDYYQNIEFSKGYLLPIINEIKYPYFRKGLIITY